METIQKYVVIDPAISQVFMSKLTGYVELWDERAEYYLWIALDSIIQIPEIKSLLREEFQEKYSENIKLFYQHFGAVNELKTLLDHTDEHTIKKNDLENPTWKRAIQIMRQDSPMIYYLMHKILTIILTKTTLRNWTIKDTDTILTEELTLEICKA
jgi:hypothetical protein